MANKYDCFHSMEMFVEDVYVCCMYKPR